MLPAAAQTCPHEPQGCGRTAIAVFDLDGVLCDTRHRLHLVTSRPKAWDAFFAAAVADPPLADGIGAARQAVAAGMSLIYLTGRPERCRVDTTQWLSAQGLPKGPLHMRRDGDHRPARLTKVEQLRRLSANHCLRVFVDDDAAVVDAVRDAGLPVMHATWMAPDTSDVDGAPGPDAREILDVIQEVEGRS
jgi:phosphoglycolate phosphatase-like HAD superfamily hydrolase